MAKFGVFATAVANGIIGKLTSALRLPVTGARGYELSSGCLSTTSPDNGHNATQLPPCLTNMVENDGPRVISTGDPDHKRPRFSRSSIFI